MPSKRFRPYNRPVDPSLNSQPFVMNFVQHYLCRMARAVGIVVFLSWWPYVTLLAQRGVPENLKSGASRSEKASSADQGQSDGFVQPTPRASSAYRLNPSDLISVSVYEEPELTASARLSEDGVVALPLIGSVKIAGKSVKEATDLITELYRKDYLVSPVVSVIVVELTKARFSVLGQVGRPGTYEIPVEGKMALMESIAMAGGFTRIASPSKITVKRGQQVFKVNGKDQASDSKAGVFWVQPGDVITVGESLF